MPVGEILQGIAMLHNTKVQADIARENTDKTIAENKRLAEYQYSKDLEMWNRGNVYNNPLEQMKRLKAAGLNPNMVYGSGSAAGMAAGQLPKYNAPTVSYNYEPPVDLPSVISAFQDFRLRNAQIRNTDLMYQKETMPVQDMSSGEVNPFYRVKGNLNLDKLGYQRNVLQAEWERRRQDSWINMPKYQREALEASSRRADQDTKRIISATRNLDLQNDYFAAKAITGLFGGAMGALGKGVAMFKRSGNAKGALSGGTIKAPRYNSPTSWKNAGY